MSSVYASRFEAVFLCTHPKGPKMTHAAAARYMQKSEGFVRKWVKRYNETKTVDDLPERATKRSTSKTDDKAIIDIFEKNPGCSLRQAKELLLKSGVHVSLNTIRQRLLDSEYGLRCTGLEPFLNNEDVEKQLEEINANIESDCENILSLTSQKECVANSSQCDS